jgi:hypothetical protein
LTREKIVRKEEGEFQLSDEDEKGEGKEDHD